MIIHMDFNTALSALLQKRKEELGLTDYDVADQSGTPRTSIRRHLLTPDTMRVTVLRRVLAVLNLTLADVHAVDLQVQHAQKVAAAVTSVAA